MSEIKFKSVKRRQVRKRRSSSDEETESEQADVDKKEEISVSVDEIKEMQAMRKRTKGISAEDLISTKQFKEQKKVEADPFKIKTGGYVDMKSIKKSSLTAQDLEAIGTSFAAETNRRDEDAEMIKYVEHELNKRKGHDSDEQKSPTKMKKAEDCLFELPEHLRALSSQKSRSEDMLSNQMLSGIPEVDLGIEAKIRNIEATEEAKQRLLEERKEQNRRRNAPDFVPTNMAVNFVQHNRFKLEDTKPIQKKKEEEPKVEPVRVGDSRPPSEMINPVDKSQKVEKSTDDFHFEKFKRQMRRF